MDVEDAEAERRKGKPSEKDQEIINNTMTELMVMLLFVFMFTNIYFASSPSNNPPVLPVNEAPKLNFLHAHYSIALK